MSAQSAQQNAAVELLYRNTHTFTVTAWVSTAVVTVLSLRDGTFSAGWFLAMAATSAVLSYASVRKLGLDREARRERSRERARVAAHHHRAKLHRQRHWRALGQEDTVVIMSKAELAATRAAASHGTVYVAPRQPWVEFAHDYNVPTDDIRI